MKKYNHLYLLTLILFFVFSCEKTKEVEENKSNGSEEVVDFKLTAEDEILLDTIEKQTFNYFWEGAEPNSGLARERLHMDDIYPTSPKNTVTTGGSGFGLMAILVGVERKFITREQALKRYQKIVAFLEKSDRFHGAWPHWINGENGKVVAFSKKDNGGDLVETAFLAQGLLTVAEYFREGNTDEKQLVNQIENLWKTIDWNWYTKGDDVLYWHWSPEYQWEMNFPVGGYNEALIMYVLAASSPTHPIQKSVYDKGWARNGDITKDTVYYGLETELDHYEHDKSPVGPLFWAHYSYLGLNPNGLQDEFVNYWDVNLNHSKINYQYCLDNPKNFPEYGDSCWGLTASYTRNPDGSIGYAAHAPGNDLGIISPTAALSSMPYTPEESIKALRYFYDNKNNLLGPAGFYDAFKPGTNWVAKAYLAIDQGPIIIMIENHRTGLLWNLFMQNEDIQLGLDKLEFTYTK